MVYSSLITIINGSVMIWQYTLHFFDLSPMLWQEDSTRSSTIWIFPRSFKSWWIITFITAGATKVIDLFFYEKKQKMYTAHTDVLLAVSAVCTFNFFKKQSYCNIIFFCKMQKQYVTLITYKVTMVIDLFYFFKRNRKCIPLIPMFYLWYVSTTDGNMTALTANLQNNFSRHSSALYSCCIKASASYFFKKCRRCRLCRRNTDFTWLFS